MQRFIVACDGHYASFVTTGGKDNPLIVRDVTWQAGDAGLMRATKFDDEQRAHEAMSQVIGLGGQVAVVPVEVGS